MAVVIHSAMNGNGSGLSTFCGSVRTGESGAASAVPASKSIEDAMTAAGLYVSNRAFI
jgi:hypothetical protein